MKKLNQILLFIMTMSLVTFTSCSKDDDGGSGGDAPSGTLVAKVDGTSFQSMEISSSATVSTNPTGQTLILIATNSDGNAVSITISGYEGVGTYEIGGGPLIFSTAAYTETNVDLSNPQNSTTEVWSAPYSEAVAGELKVSEETDTKVIGTFHFKAKNAGGDQSIKTISEGSFNLGRQNV